MSLLSLSNFPDPVPVGSAARPPALGKRQRKKGLKTGPHDRTYSGIGAVCGLSSATVATYGLALSGEKFSGLEYVALFLTVFGGLLFFGLFSVMWYRDGQAESQEAV